MSNIVIVIPTYNPSQLLLNTLADLNSYSQLQGLHKIIINDGSRQGSQYLEKAKMDYQVEVVSHAENQGKGAAIKTAMKYSLDAWKNVQFIITLDSDHQHLGKDVLSVVKSIQIHGEGMHIGYRQFPKNKTPLRSFIGNWFSRKFFYSLYRVEIKDTQSGLRAYPRACFEHLVNLKSRGFEFEMEAIINVLLRKVEIYETPIETIYINKNQSSHFRPLVDSSKVLWVILKSKVF